MLEAGAPAMMVWSPIRWSDAQFDTAQTDPAMRERVMRTFTPGMAPMSGLVRDIHESIGDYMDLDGYGWSQDPVSQTPDWLKALEDMSVCEFQTYAVVDDTWGVLQDLARLIQTQMSAFEKRRKQRRDDWAMAGVIRSLSESNYQIRRILPDATQYDLLQKTWNEHDSETRAYELDLRELSKLWGAWFNTLNLESPATLATACGHFDITQPAALEELGEQFALACVGPSSTSFGVKTLGRALDPDQVTKKPWLIWAVMGIAQRTGISEIKRLVDLGDALVDNAQALLKLGNKLAQALSMINAFNKSADNLAQHSQIKASDRLLAALSPVFAAQMRNAEDLPNSIARLYMGSALSRSQQRIDMVAATPTQISQWFSDLMGTRPQAPPETLPPKPVAGAIKEALPFLHLVSVPQVNSATKPLPSIEHLLRPEAELKNLLKMSKEALQDSPVKTLVLVVAGVNFFWGANDLKSTPSIKTAINGFGGLLGVLAAGTALVQSGAESEWKKIAKASGADSIDSRRALSSTLKIASALAFTNAIISALDIIIFGKGALEAYSAGDFDAVAANSILTIVSGANAATYFKISRVVRAARDATIIGDSLAASKLMSRVPILNLLTIGLTLVIIGGVVTLAFVQDRPLEKWLKNTRFGIRPAAWADDYESSMMEFYKVVFPIHFAIHRFNEIHPYNGAVSSTYLLLHLTGQQEFRDDTIRFEGIEIWGRGYTHKEAPQKILLTGKDFQPHIGSRVPSTRGVKTYRRIYYTNSAGWSLDKIQGKLFYSPLEGLTLPPIEIEELAWT
ncbi:hypothetical protein UCMB321_0708 [Pseudomonas batumici]|uniref:Uncharacterized protein n=2 Tax=Pseudomonas batumici TaxID=226910 RepID=A0A0C2EHS5_9PSED|nr:hypothetical protein UCMB321_0708 [Pseudomonas batumici]